MRLLFGLGCSLQPYASEVLALGDSALDVDWVLGPSARWGRYAFDVTVSRVLTADERTQVRALVEYMKPAHTHFVSLIEPGPPPPSFNWVLGTGLLSADSALAS